MKKFLIIVLAVLLSFTACTNRTPIWILPPGVLYPDNEPEPEPCKHLVLTDVEEYFDGENHYPKTGVCVECGESVTRDAIGIANADDLMLLASDINTKENIGCTDVDILADIDMAGKDWTPIIIGKENDSIKVLTIDGNDHTISNLKTIDESGSMTGIGFIGEIWNTGVTVEVKNLSIEKAEFLGTKDDTGCVGGFAGYVEAAPSITFTNCHLKSSKITSGEFAGGIYAWAAANAESTITIEGCSVDDCTLSSDGSVGGIVGHASASGKTTLTIKSSSVINSEITCTELLRTNKAGNIIGTVNCAKTSLVNASYAGNVVKSSFADIDRYVGRLEFANTGSLSIDGRDITVAE